MGGVGERFKMDHMVFRGEQRGISRRQQSIKEKIRKLTVNQLLMKGYCKNIADP